MHFNYPNGKRYFSNHQLKPVKPKELKESYGKRGMTLEEDLNETNQYYLNRGIAVIHKKPTPIQIVNVNYPKRSAAVIKEAYFQQASTTDYNGVYKGKYIDFEAKETKLTTSFPLKNFHEHQIQHMKKILEHAGICFVILRFSSLQEVYFFEAKHLLSYWERMKNGGRKSITLDEIKQSGLYIPLGFHPRLDYIKIIDQLYHF